MSHSDLSLFGKLAGVADFVRIRHTLPVSVALDVWITSAVQELYSANASWPEAPLRFVYVADDRRSALTGVLVRSRDRAGRKFPAAIYRGLPLGSSLEAAACLPLANEPLHGAIEAASEELCTLTREQAVQQLDALVVPPLELAASSRELITSLACLRADTFEHKLFVGADFAAHAQDAYVTAGQAARQMKQRRPGTTTVVDFPIRDARDASAWLTLWSMLVGTSSELPSLFWSAPIGRLLIVHGPVPNALPLWLAEPNKYRNKRIEIGVRYAATESLDATESERGDAECDGLHAQPQAAGVSLSERFEETRRASSSV